MTRPLSPEDCAKIKRVLQNKNVMLTVNNRRYKIKGFSENPLCDLLMEGKMQTVVDYYNEEQNVTLEQTHWPAILVGAKHQILLPMELCEIMKG